MEILQRSKDESTKVDDKELLDSFCKGDDAAFSVIYNRYVDVLYAYGIGLGFEREMVKDMLQDVFCKLLNSRKLLNNVTNLKFYLFRMLKNKLLDSYKSAVVAVDIQQYEYQFFTKVTVLDRLVSAEEKTEIRERIERMLGCLTDRQREALYLRFIQEMKYEAIAELLYMTPQATRKLISRGVNRIREEGLELLIWLSLLIPLLK